MGHIKPKKRKLRLQARIRRYEDIRAGRFSQMTDKTEKSYTKKPGSYNH